MKDEVRNSQSEEEEEEDEEREDEGEEEESKEAEVEHNVEQVKHTFMISFSVGHWAVRKLSRITSIRL